MKIGKYVGLEIDAITLSLVFKVTLAVSNMSPAIITAVTLLVFA